MPEKNAALEVYYNLMKKKLGNAPNTLETLIEEATAANLVEQEIGFIRGYIIGKEIKKDYPDEAALLVEPLRDHLLSNLKKKK